MDCSISQRVEHNKTLNNDTMENDTMEKSYL